MSLARSTIIRGPAQVTFNSLKIWSKGDIEVQYEIDTFEVVSSAQGKLGDRTKNRMVKVSFEPIGEWAESISVLWPYLSFIPGQSIFGTDKTLEIWTLAGQKLTYSAAAITKMPDINCSAVKTPIGSIEFTCLGADNTNWSGANSLTTVAAAAFSDYTAFSEANILTVPFTVAWGATSPWSTLQTQDGTTVTFNMSMSPVETDSEGIIDMTLGDLSVMAKLTPVGISETQLETAMAWQGAGGVAQRGKALRAVANDLVCTGSGGAPVVTVKNAAIKTAGYKFGAQSLRVGEIGFVSQRSFTSGLATAQLVLA